MRTIRAKFECVKAEEISPSQHEVRLSAVVGGSPENDSFFHATPCGELTMTTAKALFEQGKVYFLDFMVAE